MPHLAPDPVVAAAHVVLALQTIVSRNVDPRDTAVISVGSIHGGDAPNVIPDTVRLRATVRAFRHEVREMLRDRIVELVRAQAATLGVRADVEYVWRYPPVVNDEACTAFARGVALDWLGEDGVLPELEPMTGAEDFAFMLQKVPGAYLLGGVMEFAIMSPAGAAPFLKDGRLFALGVSSAARLPPLPQVPAFGEHPALKGAELDGWMALVGPKGLPQPVADRLRGVLSSSLKDPATRRKDEDIGMVAASDRDDLTKRIEADVALYTRLADFAKMRE